jgi:hypothetical protein
MKPKILLLLLILTLISCNNTGKEFDGYVLQKPANPKSTSTIPSNEPTLPTSGTIINQSNEATSSGVGTNTATDIISTGSALSSTGANN